VPNVTAVEDIDFLEAILYRHTDPDMMLMKGMEALMKAAEEPLYDESKSCTKEFTTLWSMLKLLVLKARYGWSNVGFDAFWSIIVDMLPKENKVPTNTYYAKKLISLLTMDAEKIHVCKNHGILYRGDDYKNLESCPKCGASRYKTNKTIERKSVLSPERSKRRPKRTTNKVQNPAAKKSRLLCAEKNSCFDDVVPSCSRSTEVFVC